MGNICNYGGYWMILNIISIGLIEYWTIYIVDICGSLDN